MSSLPTGRSTRTSTQTPPLVAVVIVIVIVAVVVVAVAGVVVLADLNLHMATSKSKSTTIMPWAGRCARREAFAAAEKAATSNSKSKSNRTTNAVAGQGSMVTGIRMTAVRPLAGAAAGVAEAAAGMGKEAQAAVM